MSTSAPAAVRVLERIARGGAWIGGLGLLLVSWLIVVDLAARKLFGVSLGGADELAGYVLAIASAWAFPITLLRRSHIRVDVVYTHLSPRSRVWLDLFALACLGLFVGVLTYHAWFVLADSIAFQSVSNTPLQIPQWIPQSLWFAGYAFFLLTVVVLAACALAQFTRGRWQAVNGLIGIPSMEEEIQDETAPGVGADAAVVAERAGRRADNAAQFHSHTPDQPRGAPSVGGAAAHGALEVSDADASVDPSAHARRDPRPQR